MMRFCCVLFCCLLLSSVSGCAGCRNDIAARGGLVGTYAGNYVVVNYSGNSIADVWVLKNSYVESEKGSDGWRFTDSDGNIIFIGGDVKVMRIDKDSELERWHEYHSEFEARTYQEKTLQIDKQA